MVLVGDDRGQGGALAIAIGLLVLALFASERTLGRPLLLIGLYLGLLDGYLRLRTGEGALTLARDFLIWSLAGVALLRALAERRAFRMPALGILVAAYVLIVIVSMVNPDVGSVRQALAGARQHLTFVPLFVLAWLAVRDRSSLRLYLALLVFLGAVNGLVTLYQSTLTPAELAGWGPGYAERIIGGGDFARSGRVSYGTAGASVRPFGLGSDLALGPLLCAIAIPAGLALIATTGGRMRVFGGVGLLCATLGVVYGGSRTPLVFALVGVAGFAAFGVTSRNGFRAVVAVCLGIALSGWGLGALSDHGGDAARERATSIVSRGAFTVYSEQRGASLALLGTYARQHPLGAGIGSVGPALGTSGVLAQFNGETQWNASVIELGLPGLLVTVALLAAVLVSGARRVRRLRDPSIRLALSALCGGLVALLVHGFGSTFTLNSPSAPFMWATLGVLGWWLADTATPERNLPNPS